MKKLFRKAALYMLRQSAPPQSGAWRANRGLIVVESESWQSVYLIVWNEVKARLNIFKPEMKIDIDRFACFDKRIEEMQRRLSEVLDKYYNPSNR